MTINITSPFLLSDQPYVNVGFMVAEFPDGYRARGSFSLIGRNDILTAAHVVYSPDNGGWATTMEFHFGANVDANGVVLSSHYSLTSNFSWEAVGWIDGAFTDADNDSMLWSETAYDIAVVGLSEAVGDSWGWLGASAGYNYSVSNLTSLGYPSGEYGLNEDFLSVTYNPTYNIYQTFYDVQGPGSSGGPLLVGDTVIGVKSSGGDNSSNWANLNQVWDRLVEVLAENDSLLGDGEVIAYDDVDGRNVGDAGTYSSPAEITEDLTSDGSTLISGSVGFEDDHDDYYRFTASDDGLLTATLSELSQNLNLKLLDSSANLLATSLQSGITNESIRYELTEGHNYWLRVDPHGSSESDYELFLSFAADSSENDSDSKSGSGSDDTDQEDTDLDDSDSKSGSDSSEDVIGGIELGDAGMYSSPAVIPGGEFDDGLVEITGRVGFDDDADDYYRFTAESEGQLTAKLFGLSEDLELKLLDSSRNLLVSSTNSGSAEEEISYNLMAGRNYWVRVDPFLDAESEYSLDILFEALKDNLEEVVDGGSIGDAGTYSSAANVTQYLLTDNTAAISGSVGYGEDHDDYFKFTPTNSGQLTASLSGLQDNINLKILDSDTNLLVSSTSGGTSDEQIVYDLNGGSSYWVRVDPFAASESQYRLDLAFLPASETASAEIIGTLVDVDSDPIS